MRLLLFSLFWLYAILGQAQRKIEWDSGETTIMWDNKLCLKTNPFTIIDVYSIPSYHLNIEFKLFRNIALGVEGGRYVHGYYTYHNAKGAIAKAELKYYLNSERETVGPYLSAEYFYKQQSYTSVDIIQLPSLRYSKSHLTQKEVHAASIKIGWLECVGKRFIAEGYGGLGLRLKNVNSGLTPLESKNIDTGDSNALPFVVESGKLYRPNILVGAKFGVRIF